MFPGLVQALARAQLKKGSSVPFGPSPSLDEASFQKAKDAYFASKIPPKPPGPILTPGKGMSLGGGIDAPFPKKLRFLFEPCRYKVAYGGRGGTKSWGFARALLILGALKPLRVLCAREYQNSISESVHKLLSDQIDLLRFDGIDGRPFYVVEKARIYCPATGSEFSFEGIKNNVGRIKSYEGVDICWVEEANKVTKNSWEVLIPTIRKAGSEIWVSFNPELEADDTYQRYVLNKYSIKPENLKCVKVSWRDNPWFPQELIEEKDALYRSDMDAYLNVWEGEPRVMLDGAVYANELRDLLKDERITNVPYQHEFPVDTIWDIGWADFTSIWFRQRVGHEWHFIDFYQGQFKSAAEHIRAIQSRGYTLGTIWLPHDARAKEKGSGKSYEEQVRATGHKVQIVKRLGLWDGINAARTIFPNCWFDSKKCNEGLHYLRHYRFEIRDDGKGIAGKEPIHDENSHAADAFRYAAISAKHPSGDDGLVAKMVNEIEKRWGSHVPSQTSWMGL